MTDPALFGHTIFCDDIRFEMGGKLTFVGVYEAIMYVHSEFPFVLPTLWMAIRYFEKFEAFTDEDAMLRIFLPGDDNAHPTMEGPLPLKEARRGVTFHPDGSATETRYVRIGINLALGPLAIPRAGLIKVRVQCGDEIAKIGTLLVTRSSAEPAT